MIVRKCPDISLKMPVFISFTRDWSQTVSPRCLIFNVPVCKMPTFYCGTGCSFITKLQVTEGFFIHFNLDFNHCVNFLRWWQLPYYWAGIKMYDVVAGIQCLKSSYVLSKTKALELFPMLKKDKLVGAIVYYDGESKLSACRGFFFHLLFFK